MTICVAALCGSPPDQRVIAAADRMLTAGDVEFEPVQRKINPLTASIIALTAGDAALQTEILWSVFRVVNERIKAEPQNWWFVSEVAELYARFWKQAHFKRAEAAVLSPLGLDGESFLSRQGTMSPQLVSELANKLRAFRSPGVETIFAGIDLEGSHIYVAEGEEVSCRDGVGFASIGAGYWHANSQFMFANHTRWKDFPESLLLTYSAKRRAEVAPGIGKATDMFIVGPGLGTYTGVGDHVINKLEQIYTSTQKKAQKADKQAQTAISTYVTELTKPAAPKPQEVAKPVIPEAPQAEDKNKTTGDSHE